MAVEMQNYHWASYTGGNPNEFALLKGWNGDVSTWDYAQQIEFQRWTSGMAPEAGFGPYTRPRPGYASAVDEMGPPAMGPAEHYEPGDRATWPGPSRERLSEIAQSEGVEMQQLENILEAHEAEMMSSYGGDQSSRAASEWSGQPSEWGAESSYGWSQGSKSYRMSAGTATETSGVPSESMYSGSWQTSTQGSMGRPGGSVELQEMGEAGMRDFPSSSESGPPKGFDTPEGPGSVRPGRELDPFASEASELSFAKSLPGTRPQAGEFPMDNPYGITPLRPFGETTAYGAKFGGAGRAGTLPSPPVNEYPQLAQQALDLGQGIELMPMGPSHLPEFNGDLAGLAKIPTLPEGAFDNLTAGELTSFNSAIEEATIGTSAAGDTLISASTFAQSMKNYLPGILLTPFFIWLQQQGKGGKMAVDIINATGAMLAVVSGNPVGMIAAAGGYMLQIYSEQRARIKANDWGEDVSDSRYAMVEDGGIWYPAILRSRIKGEGLFDHSNQVTMTYGRPEDFFLAADNTGKVRGHFAHPKTRNYRMSDTEYSSTGFERANEIDPFRQYYFLSNEETVDILSKYGSADFNWQVKERDTSDYTDFMKFEQDFISQLDIIKSRNDPFHDPTLNTIPASKSFRASFNDLKELSTTAFHDPDIRGGINGAYPTDVFGNETWWDSDDQWYRPSKVGMAEWYNVIDDYMPRQMEALYRTRRQAATEMGMQDKFYTDWDKDLQPAKNAEQLREQYALIDGYTDRTTLQRNYLYQKAATRAMMFKVGSAGYGKTFTDKIHTENPIDWTRLGVHGQFEKPWAGLKGLLPSYDDLWGVEEMPAWINEGEDGVPEWMPLDTDRRKKQFGSQNRIATFISEHYGSSPDDNPNTKISAFGTLHAKTKTERDKIIDAERAQMKKDLTADDVGTPKVSVGTPKVSIGIGTVLTAPKMLREGMRYYPLATKEEVRSYFPELSQFSGISREDFYLLKMFQKRQRHIKQKSVWKTKLKAIHERVVGQVSNPDTVDVHPSLHPEETVDPVAPAVQEKLVETDIAGREVTYEMVLEWIKDPHTTPAIELGEKSLSVFYDKFLRGKYSWAPKDTTIDEYNLPDKNIEGLEESFKPLLKQLSTDGDLRMKADRLHNAVHSPDTYEYLQQFHHTAKMSNAQLAKDSAGTSELFDDWALPFEKRLNQVKFNNMLHTQMRFGVSEDV